MLNIKISLGMHLKNESSLEKL